MSTGPIDEGDPVSEKYNAPYLKLYSMGTPNGVKITVYLSLLKLDYHYRKLNIMTNEQKEEWFLKLNPNGRIPVLTDVNEKGEVYPIMETGAILLYLGEKYDKERKYYYGVDAGKLYWDQIQWLTFQIASHAPYQGQANHFNSFAKEDVPYGKKRYTDETKRVFGVFERRLKDNNGWLVGDHLNIADIAAWAWIRAAPNYAKIELDEWPLIQKWIKAIEEIPGVQEGIIA